MKINLIKNNNTQKQSQPRGKPRLYLETQLKIPFKTFISRVAMRTSMVRGKNSQIMTSTPNRERNLIYHLITLNNNNK